MTRNGEDEALRLAYADPPYPGMSHFYKKPRTARPPTESKAADPVGERLALAVLAGAYADLCGADVATSIESAGVLLDAISAQRWQLVESRG